MNRLNSLDGLRGILAVTVMISHLVGALIGWDDDRAFIGAYLSVVYFFMMSGFVLSYAHDKETKFVPYAFTRLARLLPLHIISTILTVLIFYLNSKNGGYVPNEEVFQMQTILLNLFFANGVYWKDFHIINAPSWSISIEFWCSLLIPIFFNRVKLLYKIGISVVIFVYLFFEYGGGFQQSMMIAILAMLVGSICFDLTKSDTVITLIKEDNFLIFLVSSFILCCIGIYFENHSRRDFIYFFTFIPLLFIDFTPDSFLLKRILSSKYFVFLGFISFPLYLLHDVVIITGIRIHQSNILSIFLLSILSIWFAYLYARYIDLYMYKKLKKIISKYQS